MAAISFLLSQFHLDGLLVRTGLEGGVVRVEVEKYTRKTKTLLTEGKRW